MILLLFITTSLKLTTKMNLSRICCSLLLLSLTTFCMQNNNLDHALLQKKYALIRAEKQKDAANFFYCLGIGVIALSCVNALYSSDIPDQFHYYIASIGAVLAYGSHLCLNQIEAKQQALAQQKNLKDIKQQYIEYFDTIYNTPDHVTYNQKHYS